MAVIFRPRTDGRLRLKHILTKLTPRDVWTQLTTVGLIAPDRSKASSCR